MLMSVWADGRRGGSGTSSVAHVALQPSLNVFAGKFSRALVAGPRPGGAPALCSRLPALLHGGCNRGCVPDSLCSRLPALLQEGLRLRFDVETPTRAGSCRSAGRRESGDRLPAAHPLSRGPFAPAGAPTRRVQSGYVPDSSRLPALLHGGCNRGYVPDFPAPPMHGPHVLPHVDISI